MHFNDSCSPCGRRLARWVGCFALSFILITGCGDGRPGRVPVSGIVTIDGKPLEYGSIMFMPVNGGRPGGGSVASDGKFVCSYYVANDGLPVGSYKVSVSANQEIDELTQRWFAPKKYANVETSGLTVDIDRGSDALKFDLSWKGEKESAPFVEKMK